MGCQFYEMSRMGKSVEPESRFVVSRDNGEQWRMGTGLLWERAGQLLITGELSATPGCRGEPVECSRLGVD